MILIEQMGVLVLYMCWFYYISVVFFSVLVIFLCLFIGVRYWRCMGELGSGRVFLFVPLLFPAREVRKIAEREEPPEKK